VKREGRCDLSKASLVEKLELRGKRRGWGDEASEKGRPTDFMSACQEVPGTGIEYSEYRYPGTYQGTRYQVQRIQIECAYWVRMYYSSVHILVSSNLYRVGVRVAISNLYIRS